MRCNTCDSEGPFYVGHSIGYCKACCRARAKMYRERDPEYGKRWREKNQERVRDYALLREYGLTGAEYDQLSANQGDACAICGDVPGGRSLCVDHDHTTGAVRGLLCSPCNWALGHLKDDPRLLRGALQYLAAPPAQGALTLREAA